MGRRGGRRGTSRWGGSAGGEGMRRAHLGADGATDGGHVAEEGPPMMRGGGEKGEGRHPRPCSRALRVGALQQVPPPPPSTDKPDMGGVAKGAGLQSRRSTPRGLEWAHSLQSIWSNRRWQRKLLGAGQTSRGGAPNTSFKGARIRRPPELRAVRRVRHATWPDKEATSATAGV